MGDAVDAIKNGITSGVNGIVNGVGDFLKDPAGNLIHKVGVADQTLINNSLGDLTSAQYNNYLNQLQRQQDAKNALGSAQFNLNQGGQDLNQANVMNTQGNVANALNYLQNAASGNAPSAAQAQLQSGKDQAIATQFALANSGNTSQMIGGQKEAMMNAANLNQQAANQAAILRANEMAAARGQYAQGSAQQASQAAQNVGLRGQQAAQYGNLYNTAQAASNAQDALRQSAASSAGQLALGATGLQQGVNTANAANANAVTGGLLNGIGAIAGTSILADAMKSAPAAAVPAGGSAGAVSMAPAAGPSAAAIGGAAMMSDTTNKKDIRDTSPSKFFEALEAKKYKYKKTDGQLGRTPGEHIGIIAQDVEKAPGGKSIVKNTSEGKAIDIASAVGTLMAGAAETAQRLKELEHYFKTSKKKKG